MPLAHNCQGRKAHSVPYTEVYVDALGDKKPKVVGEKGGALRKVELDDPPHYLGTGAPPKDMLRQLR